MTRPGQQRSKDATALQSTPREATEALLSIFPPATTCVFEPCAGLGAIVDVLASRRHSVAALEIVLERAHQLRTRFPRVMTFVGDAIEACKRSTAPDCGEWNQWSIVTNPPFAMPECLVLVRGFLGLPVPYVALLLPVRFRHHRGWRGVWNGLTQEIVLPRQQWGDTGEDSPTGTDECSWFVWRRDGGLTPYPYRPTHFFYR